MSSASLDKRAMALMAAALDQPSEDRIKWVQAASKGDSELAQRVITLLNVDKGASNQILRTGGAGQDVGEPPLPERIGPFRIIDCIGQGGMGAVYKAMRDIENFDHIVAIKVIRPGLMAESLIERLQRERQILANLNHPNIARLYDGGETDDGSPYIVMEYIDGKPLIDWADGRNLDLEDRIWIFRDLCQAVRYAHQNLIIHRDLTPSNVLVTQNGSVKLIDFGIAKPQNAGDLHLSGGGSETSATLAGLSFTPGYAAPERSSGTAPNTLSDIFSLGRLFEKLIKNCRPNRDLSSIIKQASANDPADRYPSVDSLIDDIDNFCQHKPVTAHKDSTAYRFGKLFKRRRWSILAASIFVVGLSAALGNALLHYQRAETARLQADQHFNETRALTSFLLEDLTKGLGELPGTLPLMETVSEVSANYLDILSGAAATDASVKFDYAKGRARLAEVLTQGGGANLGRPEKGIDNFLESLRVLEELAAQDNPSSLVLAELASTKTGYGYSIAYHLGEWDRGMAITESSLELHNLVTANDPDNAQWALNRLRAQSILAYSKLGNDEAYFAEMHAAREGYAAALTTFPDYSRTKPEYVSFLRIISNAALDRWAGLADETVPIVDRDRYEQALIDIRLSIELASQLIIEEPNNPEHYYQYIWSQEIESLLVSIRLEWVTTFDGLMQELASTQPLQSNQDLRSTIMKRSDYQERLEVYNYMSEQLDKSDQYLWRMGLFDSETFSHYEAVYYNLEARAYLALQVMFDFDEGIKYLDYVIQHADTYIARTPNERIWHYEGAEAVLEKAYVLLIRQTVLSDDHTFEICELVKVGVAQWSSAQERWADEVYAGTYEFGSAISQAAGCPLLP